jgi:hypothetical protein
MELHEMNISEILRALLDKLDSIESSNTEPENEPSQEKMLPPLQLKSELLKKEVGVASEFDDAEEDCGCDDDSTDIDQDLANIKKNAGIMIKYGDDDLLS